eukprot:INCI6703.2.p1 GENE.INCI6703.2~~INCI6703.2.p1  ORF type:complete len:411 (-),score=47.11 INCI6703.2:327-1559(-)
MMPKRVNSSRGRGLQSWGVLLLLSFSTLSRLFHLASASRVSALNVPSVYVPVLMPPAVTTDTVNISPEELVRASLPWDGMEMRADDLARWNLDRYNEHGAGGKGVEIPVAVPPTYHGSGDLDKQRDAQLNMDNWIHVVEAPTLPDSAGPTLYTSHQKPSGYYRNPYTVPKISFLQIDSSEAGVSSASLRASKNLRGQARVSHSQLGSKETKERGDDHDSMQIVSVEGSNSQPLLRGSYPAPGERPLPTGHPSSSDTFGGYDAAGYPSTLPGVSSSTVVPGQRSPPTRSLLLELDAQTVGTGTDHMATGASVSSESASSAALFSSLSESNAEGAGKPFTYDMLPYLKLRSKLLQYAANDQSEQAQILDRMNFAATPDESSWLKPPQFSSRNYFFPTTGSDLDSNHPQHKPE